MKSRGSNNRYSISTGTASTEQSAGPNWGPTNDPGPTTSLPDNDEFAGQTTRQTMGGLDGAGKRVLDGAQSSLRGLAVSTADEGQDRQDFRDARIEKAADFAASRGKSPGTELQY